MRLTFILLRALGYATLFVSMFANGHRPAWQWLISLLIAASGVWERWKRPDDAVPVLLRGVWEETVLLWLWAGVMQEVVVLFLLVSPLMRACVHMRWRSCLVVVGLHLLSVDLFARLYSHAVWVEPTLYGGLVLLGTYSYVLGQLVRERDKARRLVTMATFEREQRVKDEERVRIATQLHDVMGQYWTAVVRALDVAAAVEGEARVQFVGKAREAALQGLQEMRAAVHDWHDGRQTPEQWMEYLELSLARVREFVGADVRMVRDVVEWHRFEEAMLVAEVIARTVLESVTNAIRHGGATVIGVSMRVGDEEVQVEICDDGSGHVAGVADAGSGGIGLATMRRLAESVGGDWQIVGGRGVCIRLTVPYQRARMEMVAERRSG